MAPQNPSTHLSTWQLLPQTQNLSISLSGNLLAGLVGIASGGLGPLGFPNFC